MKSSASAIVNARSQGVQHHAWSGEAICAPARSGHTEQPLQPTEKVQPSANCVVRGLRMDCTAVQRASVPRVLQTPLGARSHARPQKRWLGQHFSRIERRSTVLAAVEPKASWWIARIESLFWMRGPST